jgi:hypothetical protein
MVPVCGWRDEQYFDVGSEFTATTWQQRYKITLNYKTTRRHINILQSMDIIHNTHNTFLQI